MYLYIFIDTGVQTSQCTMVAPMVHWLVYRSGCPEGSNDLCVAGIYLQHRAFNVLQRDGI